MEKQIFNTDANHKLYLLNETIKSIPFNFIPHEFIVCDDRDSSWSNRSARRNAKQCKITVIFNYFKDFRAFRILTVTTDKSKQQFYSRVLNKLMDLATSSKVYWSVLKRFLNNKKYLAFYQFDVMIITSQISKRKLRLLTISLLNSAL